MVDDLQRNRIDGLGSPGDAPTAATMASTSLLAPATRLLWAAFWGFLVAIPPLYRAQVELKNATDSDQLQAADLWAAVGEGIAVLGYVFLVVGAALLTAARLDFF